MEYGAAADWASGVILAMWSSMMCLTWLVPMVLGVLCTVVWVVALVDILQRDPSDFPHAREGRDDPNERLIWILIVLLVGFMGAIVYYFIVMKPFPRTGPVPRPASDAEAGQDPPTASDV